MFARVYTNSIFGYRFYSFPYELNFRVNTVSLVSVRRIEIAKLVGMSRALLTVDDLEWARRASAGTLATHRR